MSYTQVGYEDLKETISSVDFSPSGDFLVIGQIDEKITVYKTDFTSNDKLEEYFKADGHSMGVCDVKINYKGDRIAASSLDSVITVWDIENKKKLNEIQGQEMQNFKVSFLGESNTLISAGELGKLHTYDIESAEILKQFATNDIFGSAVSSSKDGKFVALGNSSGQVFYFDVTDNWKPFRVDAHQKIIRGLSFTQDCRRIITASDDTTAKVIDLEKRETISNFQGHKGNVNCVDTNPKDNELFVTCSYDRTVKIWDMRQKTCVETINEHNDNVWAAKFNNQGNVIGSVAENGVLYLHENSK